MIGQKISVLIVDTAIDFGGSIVSTANLIRGLDRERFEPTFVSATSEELVCRKLAEAAGSTQVVIAKKSFHYGRIGALTAKLGKIRFKLLRKSLIYGLYLIRLVANLPFAIRIALLIHRRSVDLVQLNNSFGNDEVEFLCLLLRRPRVVFFRGYVRLSAIERWLFLHGTTAFVSVSEYVKQKAIRDGVPGEKIVVATPPAIVDTLDEEHLQAVRARYGVRVDAPTFGIFGRIVNWKGQKEFLQAAAMVIEAIPTARVFFVGDTSDGDARYLAELKELVREKTIEDHVIFTGYVERVYELYGVMDVVVHSSIDPEPSGRVIFEAMSCGVPVVASCLGGPKEFIDDGVDGYICDPREPRAVADRIVTLLSNDELRSRMGGKAREKVERLYNKRRYASLIEDVYLNAVGQRQSRAQEQGMK
jgi:glycosyltransferase involved in cell wall biosynthesis